MRISWPLSLLVLTACGPKAPAASETLPRLRDAITAPVDSAERNKQNSELVQLISDEGHLLGLSRLEVEERVGKGDDCASHPICAEKGFDPEDWYYEVGQMGDSYQRLRPALIVGFNRFGKVVRTYNLRVE